MSNQRETTIILPSLHPAQREIESSPARFKAVACGRRFGKTLYGQRDLIPDMIRGFPVAWFAPDYKRIREVWEEISTTLKPLIKSKNKSEWVIRLYGGGFMDFWSLKDNEDAGRSRKYKRIIIDEAAICDNLETVWESAIRATLTDYEGTATLLSSPKGRNFFQTAFDRGRSDDPRWKDWASFHFPTERNPYIKPSEIETAKGELPDRVFRQEYLAEFLENSGGVFQFVRECIDKTRLKNLPFDPRNAYVVGVDLARLEDFTVICVLDRSGRQVHFQRLNRTGWQAQCELIAMISRRFRAPVILDATGVGDPIHESLQIMGIDAVPFVISGATKVPLIDALALAIEQKHVTLMDIDIQTSELLAYQYEMRGRTIKMSAPEGMHDDTVIALALANHGLRYAGGLQYFQ